MATTKTRRRPGPKATGLIAAGLGAALLLGTGGTFALWQATDDITGATFQTGHLTLDHQPLTWHLNNQPVDDLSTVSLKPGQKLVGTTQIQAGLAGTNLTATLTTAGGEAILPAKPIPERLGITVTVLIDGHVPGELAPAILYQSGTVPVEVEIYFPSLSRVYDEYATAIEIGFDDLIVTLTQN